MEYIREARRDLEVKTVDLIYSQILIASYVRNNGMVRWDMGVRYGCRDKVLVNLFTTVLVYFSLSGQFYVYCKYEFNYLTSESVLTRYRTRFDTHLY